MNNEQQQIIDDAYENYRTTLIGSITFSERGKHFKSDGLEFNSGYPNYVHYSQEEFINKCKIDPEFSEKWGLKIEERELSLEERVVIFNQKKEKGEIVIPEFKSVGDMNAWTNRLLDNDIPTKLITVTRELSEDEIWDYIHKNKIEILHQHAVLYSHAVGSEYRKSFIPTLIVHYNIPTKETIESYE